MSKKYWSRTKSSRSRAGAILKELELRGKLSPTPPGQTIIAEFYPLEVEVKLRALAELMDGSWPSGAKIGWTFLRGAIDKVGASGQWSLEAIEQELDAVWAAHAKREAADKLPFRVVYAWPARMPREGELPSHVSICGNTVAFHRFSTAEECTRQPVSECPVPIQFLFGGHSPTFYTELTIESPTAHNAMAKAQSLIEPWRWMYNFEKSQRVLQMSFSQAPRAALREPLWMFSKHGDKWFWQMREEGVKPSEPKGFVEPFEVRDALAALDRLDSLGDVVPRESTNRLLRDAHHLFSLALDQGPWHQALLVFWQLAEHLTLIARTESHYEICKRLPLLGLCAKGLPREQAEHALRGTMNVRNTIVHRSDFGSATDHDVDFLRRCCVTAMQWLHQRRDVLPTRKHLHRYFELARRDAAELDCTSDVLSLVSGERGKTDG